MTQPTHRALPTPIYPLIDLTAGGFGESSFYHGYIIFMHEEFDKIDPEIPTLIQRTG